MDIRRCCRQLNKTIMETEILNIDYHLKRIILKALNTSLYKYQAAKKLGITIRSLLRKIIDYDIEYSVRAGRYIIKEKKEIKAL